MKIGPVVQKCAVLIRFSRVPEDQKGAYGAHPEGHQAGEGAPGDQKRAV